VPLWSLFEIMMMGDFGSLLECLDLQTRDEITKALGMNLAADTNWELIYKYLYAFKDLRNAIAHNDVIFDARFRRIDPTKAMKDCLQRDIALPFVNFKSIGDYVILTCYYLKNLGVTKTEIKSFIREFEKVTDDYRALVSPAVADIVVRGDLQQRMTILKNYVG